MTVPRIHRADVRTAIQKLYQTGRFSDISVDAELQGEVVTLRIATELNYFVSGVAIDGVADPPKKSQLLTAAKLELGVEYRRRRSPAGQPRTWRSVFARTASTWPR